MTDGLHQQLSRSAAAAQGRNAKPGADPVIPCAQAAAWIELEVVGAKNEPLADQAYELTPASGGARKGKTGAAGTAREEALPPGPCKLRLIGVDRSAWDGAPISRLEEAEPLRHVVKAGESLATLAHRYGLLPEAIWSHPGNARLRARRSEPRLLGKGDTLVIPACTEKVISLAANQRHRIVRRGPSLETFRLELRDRKGAPRRALAFLLEVDGVLHRGVTGEDGSIEAQVPVHATEARLRVRDGGREELHNLALRQLLPLDDPKGIQQRLRSLGHDCVGDPPGGPRTAAALQAIQRAAGLATTGAADAKTLAALDRAYRGR